VEKGRELDQVPIPSVVSTSDIQPSPENDDIYGAVDPDDPETIDLVKSIREFGVREPLQVSEDGYILSGHRRYAAAGLAGLDAVPVLWVSIRREDDLAQWVLLLREHNRQRDKSLSVRLREELVDADPRESHRALTEYREGLSQIDTEAFSIDGTKRRAKITEAKRPMLDAVLRVLEDRRAFWPLSARAIHYALLNDPPLIHASKPKSRYGNTAASYKSLVDLLTRARLAGKVPFAAIEDVTRPVSTWEVYDTPRRFIRKEIDGFLKGYYRDLMQSQPHHVEIVCEKNTVEPILRPIAMEFTIPLTSGRGYCSLPPRQAMEQRWLASRKNKLILLVVSDHDPDGDAIAHSLARSMRDDFGIDDVYPIKVALTAEQVVEHKLPLGMKAKTTSANYKRFVREHGNDNAYELEALEPATLQTILTEAIESVINIDRYNYEVYRESEDAAFLDGLRQTVHVALKQMNLESLDADDE
jgi:hypothetical protein